MKKIILIVLAIIALPLIFALFIKKTYHVERSIIVNESQKEVYHFLKYVKNQKVFAVWSQYDPNMKETTTGTDGEIGFVQRWESDHEKVGVGEQEIIKLTPYSRIDYAFRFYKPFEALDDSGYFQFTPIETGKTKVTWGYDGKMKYPTNILMLFIDFDDLIGSDFEKGLENLKKYYQ